MPKVSREVTVFENEADFKAHTPGERDKPWKVHMHGRTMYVHHTSAANALTAAAKYIGLTAESLAEPRQKSGPVTKLAAKIGELTDAEKQRLRELLG